MMPKRKQYHKLDKHQRADLRKDAVKRFRAGESSTELAAEFGVSPQTILNWMRTYEEEGLKGLAHRPRGPACALDERELKLLARALRSRASRYGFPDDRWTLGRITEYVAEEFGVEYAPRSLYHVVKKLGVDPFERSKPRKRRKK